VTVPPRLANEAVFTARAALLPHDWRDGRGAVRASVAVTAGGAAPCEVWSGTLRASDRGNPRGRAVRCRIPATAAELRLTIDPGPPGHRAVAPALWVEPAIVDPAAPRQL
jgi:hypothetical protein